MFMARAIREGNPAPDFELPSTAGKVRLSNFRGRKVVLYFYPKDDTPGCTAEACSFRDNIEKIQKQGAVVLGISRDTIESHEKFIKKYSLNFPLLSDEKLLAHRLYGTWKKKEMYGKEYWGTERSTFIIDEEGKILKIFRGVKVNGHVEQVLEMLKS